MSEVPLYRQCTASVFKQKGVGYQAIFFSPLRKVMIFLIPSFHRILPYGIA